MATVLLGHIRTAYDRLSASWKDNYWSVLRRANIQVPRWHQTKTVTKVVTYEFDLHDNAPVHKSLVAQQALCNCEFVQRNHPAYSLDLAPSNYFLIRNLKHRLHGTWLTDEGSLKIAMKARSESQNRKFYFHGINSWEEKLKICIDVAWEYVKE